MEKLLQNIVKKFIKQIDFSKIKLKNVQNGHADEIDSSTEEGNDYHVYQIKYSVLTVGTVITVTNRIEGTKYLSNIDIIAPFRSRGIGSYVLKHWFSGYYIMADNTRAGKLYARLGKVYNKFTHREFEEFIKLAGLRGVYKLDSKKAMNKSETRRLIDALICRRHADALRIKQLRKKLNDDYYNAEGTKAFQKIYRLADKVLKELPKFGAKMFDQVGDDFLGSKGERGLEIAEKALHRILGNTAYVTTDPGSIPLNAPRIKNDIKESLKGIAAFESAENRTPETTKFKMILQTALHLI